jgi:hypothetical protein
MLGEALMKRLALVLTTCALLAVRVGAQGSPPPPINPTIVPEGSSNTFYKGAHAVLVAAVEGITHVYEFTKDLILPGKHNDALADLREGSTVAVQANAGGSRAAADEVDANGNTRAGVSEGTVTKVDRRHAQITVRFGEGQNGTFQLAEAHAKGSSAHGSAPEPPVEISYSGKDGTRVKQLFSKISGS